VTSHLGLLRRGLWLDLLHFLDHCLDSVHGLHAHFLQRDLQEDPVRLCRDVNDYVLTSTLSLSARNRLSLSSGARRAPSKVTHLVCHTVAKHESTVVCCVFGTSMWLSVRVGSTIMLGVHFAEPLRHNIHQVSHSLALLQRRVHQ
jgi:hypothetical protein